MTYVTPEYRAVSYWLGVMKSVEPAGIESGSG